MSAKPAPSTIIHKNLQRIGWFSSILGGCFTAVLPAVVVIMFAVKEEAGEQLTTQLPNTITLAGIFAVMLLGGLLCLKTKPLPLRLIGAMLAIASLIAVPLFMRSLVG